MKALSKTLMTYYSNTFNTQSQRYAILDTP
jgi:hypothetical protein